MGVWRGLVWAFARHTEIGRKALGRETLLEQAVRERAELADREQIVDEAYRRIQSKYQPGPADLQYLDGDYRVEVKSGYSFDHGRPTTEIFIFPRQGHSSSHWHIVIDDRGNEIMNQWRQK